MENKLYKANFLQIWWYCIWFKKQFNQR